MFLRTLLAALVLVLAAGCATTPKDRIPPKVEYAS